jgi:hypothetical protein
MRCVSRMDATDARRPSSRAFRSPSGVRFWTASRGSAARPRFELDLSDRAEVCVMWLRRKIPTVHDEASPGMSRSTIRSRSCSHRILAERTTYAPRRHRTLPGGDEVRGGPSRPPRAPNSRAGPPRATKCCERGRTTSQGATPTWRQRIRRNRPDGVNPEKRPQPRVSPRAGAALGSPAATEAQTSDDATLACVYRPNRHEHYKTKTGVPTTHVSDGFGHAEVIRTGVGREAPAMNTPVVASSTTTGWLTVACPWCGTINNIGLFGVQTLPGCGHVLDVQRPVHVPRHHPQRDHGEV